jgi:transposase
MLSFGSTEQGRPGAISLTSSAFGTASSRRFRRWPKKGVWERFFNALRENPDYEYLIIDAAVVRAHQHAAGAKKGRR